MFVNHVFRSRLLVAGILAAFLLLVAPVGEFAQVKSMSPPGSLVGFIYDRDMRTPVPNAVVKLRNVAKDRAYDSSPSDANGMYKITGIEEGRYVLGVSAVNRGDYNFDYALSLKGGEMAKLSVALTPGGQMSGADAKQKSFFFSPMGIVTIVLVAGAVLYGVLAPKEEASPIR